MNPKWISSSQWVKKRIPIEVKYRKRIDPFEDTRGLRSSSKKPSTTPLCPTGHPRRQRPNPRPPNHPHLPLLAPLVALTSTSAPSPLIPRLSDFHAALLNCIYEGMNRSGESILALSVRQPFAEMILRGIKGWSFGRGGRTSVAGCCCMPPENDALILRPGKCSTPLGTA